MLSWPCTLAALLYLVPVAVLWLARHRSGRASWELALDVPFAVSIDLLAIMTISSFVTLERAVFTSRILWAALGIAALVVKVRRRRSVSVWARPSIDAVVGVLLSAVLAFLLSYSLSRPYAIWDRELHIPTVSSLRGQTLPFATAYEPGHGFHYHFAGDVLAAVVQILSFDTIHSSLALSLAHDVVFALTAASIALLSYSFGLRRALPLAVGSIAMLLMGPCVFRGNIGEPYLGYSYYAFLIWGFRPHQHLAALLFVGFIGSIVVRCSGPSGQVSDRRTLPVLLAATALMAVTDETSLGVLGLSLGVAWLFDRRAVSDSRWTGVIVFVALLVVAAGSNLFFGAALSRGGPVHEIAWVPLRSPGVQRPPLLLSTPEGRKALFFDLLPTLSCAVAAVMTMSVRRGSRERALVAFIASLLLISVTGLVGIEINHAPPESHRFISAALFILPLVALLKLESMPRGRLGRLLFFGGSAAAISSTLLWVSHYSFAHCTPEANFRQQGRASLHQMDCRVETGVRPGVRPAPTYIESSLWYYFAGCYPVFSPGVTVSYWPMKLYPQGGVAALTELDRWLGKSESLDAVCPSASNASKDVVCQYAMTKTRCSPQGETFVRCRLDGPARAALIGERDDARDRASTTPETRQVGLE